MYVISLNFKLVTSEFREVSLINFVPRASREKTDREDEGPCECGWS